MIPFTFTSLFWPEIYDSIQNESTLKNSIAAKNFIFFAGSL